MACPFDVRALIGRTFSSVLDEISPGWGPGDFMNDSGPSAEIQRKAEPMVAALRELTVVLLDIDGTAVPCRVWYSGRWWFYRDEGRGAEWLEALTETGQKVSYYSPRFARPAIEGSDMEPARSGKRRGRKPIDDTNNVKLVQAEMKAKGSSIRAATEEVAARLIGDKPENVRLAWIDRVRGKVPNEPPD